MAVSCGMVYVPMLWLASCRVTKSYWAAARSTGSGLEQPAMMVKAMAAADTVRTMRRASERPSWSRRPDADLFTINSLRPGGHAQVGRQIGSHSRLLAQEVAHVHDIIDRDFSGLVGPAVADEVHHLGDIGIGELVERRHAEGHAVVRRVRHAAAAESYRQHRVRIARIHRAVAIQRREDAGHPLAVGTVADHAVLDVQQGAARVMVTVQQLLGGEVRLG